MTGGFVIVDVLGVLEREDFLTLHDALTRTGDAPWSTTAWRIFGPDGHLAASPSQRIPQQRKDAS